MAEWHNLFLLKRAIKQQGIQSWRRHHANGGKQLARTAVDADST